MKKLVFSLLLLSPLAMAQSGACDESDCGDCSDKACSSKDVVTARADLSSWRGEMRQLSRVERTALSDAYNTVSSKHPAAKLLGPTFGASADMLSVMAALESAVDPKSKTAKMAMEMSNTYRAMARQLDPKNSYAPIKISSTDELKAALKKCDAEAKRIQKMWAEAKKVEISASDRADIVSAMKVLEKGHPMMRAMAMNAKIMAKGYKSLKCKEAPKADGDMRPMLMSTSKNLHAMAAPFFA
ncbi:MAG: hypothetical protein AAGD14_14795, partial [Planctomycetota bacterium]